MTNARNRYISYGIISIIAIISLSVFAWGLSDHSGPEKKSGHPTVKIEPKNFQLLAATSHDDLAKAFNSPANQRLAAFNKKLEENITSLSNVFHWNDVIKWNNAKPKIYIHSISHNYAPVVHHAPTYSSGNYGGLSGVVQCIKNHESGNYSESSHTGSGSGAYQFIPGTWRYYSALAGYPGYAYAYLAPPAVQDATLMYALTHGGAGNWSPRYGNDPCTVGLGG